jgi:hypothetical protein
MSDPHSRSPTPNHPSFTNTLFPSEPTPSRPDTHEYTPLYPIEETTQQSISRHTPSHSFRSQTPYPRSAEVSITPVLTRSPQVSPGRLARPMREQSPEEKAGRRTPSSSSQGDMADTEMDAERSQQVMMSTPPVTVPSKKKRTRTLTTPHQSAVLHALLAQVCKLVFQFKAACQPPDSLAFRPQPCVKRLAGLLV